MIRRQAATSGAACSESQAFCIHNFSMGIVSRAAQPQGGGLFCKARGQPGALGFPGGRLHVPLPLFCRRNRGKCPKCSGRKV